MKVMRLDDVYIRVDIDPGWIVKDRADELRKLNYAADIKASIRRHVDGVDVVEIVEEFKGVCGYCGGIWTEDSSSYNGGCCGDDEAYNPNPEE